MLNERVGCQFVRVWNCMVYAIGGRADGHCERYDVNLDRWETIARYPEPMSLSQAQSVNIYEKFLYVISNDMVTGLKIWRLDIGL